MSWIKDKVFTNADEFLSWLDENFGEYINKHISEQHTHHTWSPNHSHYTKYDTLQLHKNMRNYHVNTNKWADIAQHITIGKDGDIVLGRDIRQVPVSATGYNGTTNLHPFAYEMVGNFDVNNDLLQNLQLESAIKISRYFYNKGKAIKFHRELLLPNGKVPKSCPGTGVDKGWFMELVKGNETPQSQPAQPVSQPKPQPKPVEQPKPQPVQPTYPLLRKGDRGEKVKEMQSLLNKYGYGLKVDGDFGNLSEAALRDFQKNNGLEIDGLCGDQSWSKLKSGNAVHKKIAQPTSVQQPKPQSKKLVYTRLLKFGVKGIDVGELQTALNKLNFNCGKVDSDFGLKTKDSVIRFQKVYLPHEIDGVAGRNTINKINELL